MDASEILADVFDRGLKDGVNSLSPREQELFYIQDFIIDVEMGGLSSYFYNRLPDVDRIRVAVRALRKHNLLALAGILELAAELFNSYVDPDPPATWEETLRQYDPSDRLSECEKRMRELRGYGLAESTII